MKQLIEITKSLFISMLISFIAFNLKAQQTGTFTDSRDGKTYKTVKIGRQVWMAQNLDYKLDSSWCYENNNSNCTQYGRLYNWEAAKKACPEGFHLPLKSEFDTLINNTGGRASYKSLIKGGNSGFSATLGGYYSINDGFKHIGEYFLLWSSSQGDPWTVWSLYGSREYSFSQMGLVYRSDIISVRCLQDY